MVVVFVLRTGNQCDRANPKLAQLSAGRELCADAFEVNIPAACKRFAPQERTVQIQQLATAALLNSLHQLIWLRLSLVVPCRYSHYRSWSYSASAANRA